MCGLEPLMLTVDFYLLPPLCDDPITVACDFAKQAFLEKHKLLIVCNTLLDAQAIDKKLWVFSDVSFIPHALAENEQAIHAPIVIDHQFEATSHDYQWLINLSDKIPADHRKFERIIEFVPSDGAKRQISRAHYKHYQTNTCEVRTKTLGGV